MPTKKDEQPPYEGLLAVVGYDVSFISSSLTWPPCQLSPLSSRHYAAELSLFFLLAERVGAVRLLRGDKIRPEGAGSRRQLISHYSRQRLLPSSHADARSRLARLGLRRRPADCQPGPGPQSPARRRRLPARSALLFTLMPRRRLCHWRRRLRRAVLRRLYLPRHRAFQAEAGDFADFGAAHG